MIALDTNVLVYAHREDSPQHERAAEALSAAVLGPVSVGIPWPCVHEFLAIVTHPRIYDPPTAMSQALVAIGQLADQPTVRFLPEEGHHLAMLTGLLKDSAVVGPKVHDARIAAICLGHGVSVLWTADRDFSWFPNLRTHNPLASGGSR